MVFAQAKRGGSYLVEGHKAPLYFLDEATRVETLTVPPMAEGIESFEGRVYVSDESASNKYIFGKLYGAGKVYALDMNG